MPLLYAKKEVFNWLKQAKKSIDIRKGKPQKGSILVFLSGRHSLKFKIVKTECGLLGDVLRVDNYRLVIPSAVDLADAVDYLRRIYGVCDGVFTAYYIEALCDSENVRVAGENEL